jgi:hypothetical protein
MRRCREWYVRVWEKEVYFKVGLRFRQSLGDMRKTTKYLRIAVNVADIRTD